MIKKILEDWNNRVGGNLNHKKESHLFELGSMLWEQGWSCLLYTSPSPRDA